MNNYTSSDLHSLLRQVNPLGLRDNDGVLMVFKRQADCLLHFFQHVHENYPQGYIDMVQLFHKLQQLPPNILYDMVGKAEILIIPTWENTDERNKKLCQLVEIATYPTGAYVSKEQIALSLFYLDVYLESKCKNKLITNLKLKLV